MILEVGSVHMQDQRVFLRQLALTDVTDAYVSWLNDPQVSRYLLGDIKHHTRTSTAEFVSTAQASSDALLLGIYLSAEPEQHVGNVRFSSIRAAHGTAEIGILIGERRLWGHGLATEALHLSIVLGATRLGLRKLTAGCLSSNVGSIRAFEKAGFVEAGVRTGQFLLDGVPEDEILLECHLR